MAESRIAKTIRNSCVGFLTHALTMVISFVSRTLFIKILGAQYLGVSGLYTNILSVLALSDLGLYTVMTFSLYKPIAEHDEAKIAALTRYYKKLYYYIALAVMAIGLSLIPLLPVLVNNSTLPQDELVLYYVLLLMNSVCSYFAISKATLIRADQNAYIIQIVTTASTFLMHVGQIVMLVITHNYAFYLVVQILFTLVNNVALSVITTWKYPYLKKNSTVEVSKEVKRTLLSNLKNTFLYKLGATIINSTDNILISMILGTVIVGYYNNYYTIVLMVNALITIVIQAVLGSIGNFNATENRQKKFLLFRQLALFFYIVAAFCSACYLSVFEDFIQIWIGDEYRLGKAFVCVFVFKIFIQCTDNPLWMFRESSGTFYSTRYVMLVAAFFNILLSVIMGKAWGLCGIILATAISYLITLWWYEPLQLCKNVFFVGVSAYWKYVAKLLRYCVPVVAAGFALQQWEVHSIALIFVKIAICGGVTAAVFGGFLWRTEEFLFIRQIAFKLRGKLCRDKG